jgi:hypothetical protein
MSEHAVAKQIEQLQYPFAVWGLTDGCKDAEGFNRAAPGFGLVHYVVMGWLVLHEQLPPQVLSDRLGLPVGDVERALCELEQFGLASRDSDDWD